MVKLKISKENEFVKVPKKRDEDAGYDLFVDPIWFKEKYGSYIHLKPQQTIMLSTGIRTIISSDYYIQIQERGSTGVKAMKYGAGVIDSGFNGIHNVVITNCSDKTIVLHDSRVTPIEDDQVYYSIDKAVAQFVILPVPKVEIEEVSVDEVLNRESERGESMLGSTNK